MNTHAEAGTMNGTPRGERIHIAFFGMRNAGKSSLVNAVTGQNLSIVSDIKGTTTDPVYKSMELLPLGPVTIIDTPGFDDEGEIGGLRIQKTRSVLQKTDIALLAVDGTAGLCDMDKSLIALFKERAIPYIVVFTKYDITGNAPAPEDAAHCIAVSAKTGYRITDLKNMIANLPEIAAIRAEETERRIIGDLLSPGDLAVLVIPVDKAAPKGRLILPQQQTIRDILDSHAAAVTVQTDGLAALLATLQKVRIVVTDSQAFAEVAAIVPETIPLTSFSILFSRYKGDLDRQVQGAFALDTIADGDRILISEACTHHRQCGDIGTEKLPAWIRKYTKCNPQFEFSSGTEFPEDLQDIKLVIHCGACMITAREMHHRIAAATNRAVPMTNYGTAIAHMNGILKRALAPVLPDR